MGEAESSAGPSTPLDALGVLADQEVEITPELRHLELYTMRGLLTVLWHGRPAQPPGDGATGATARSAGSGAVVACGGAMGGLLGPAEGLYQRLGVELAGQGASVLRVSYRRPNDLDACCLDVAAAVQLAVGNGAERVVVIGHCFGGAVAVRVGVALPSSSPAWSPSPRSRPAARSPAASMAGRSCCSTATATSSCRSRPAIVRDIAGHGELVVLPGDGHLLAKSGPILCERLFEWLPDVLGVPLDP